jgi:hypothetical protein
MHRQAFDFIAARARDLGRVGFVLEIGARNINGTVRNLFDAERYVGLDVMPGPGVDVVASGADYVPDTPADVIVCCEVLEHTEEAAAICRRSIENLAPGGVLLLTMAGTERAPHSAIDGCDLREGEFYRNVSAADLQEWLADADCTLTVGENPAAGDTYALAQKNGLGARLCLSVPNPLALKSVLLWYPGSSVSTSDVAAGLQYGLEQTGVKVIPYRTEVEMTLAEITLMTLWKKQGSPKDRRPNEADKIYRAGKSVVADAVRARLEHGVEWVFVVSGMYQHPDYYIFLRNCGFKVALICTETPYDIEYELRASKHVDVVFTNERSALDAFRAVHAHVEYLPHAWHPGVHAVMERGDEEQVQSHDVVFVGTYFQERVEFLAAIDWSGIDLGLYGGTEDFDARTKAGRLLKPFVRGLLMKNAKTAALYRHAKVGLNFHRKSKGYGPHVARITHAESLNPRCYELAATGCYFVSDVRAEASDIFGDALDTFSTPEECEALIRSALADDARRQQKARQCQQAVQEHTWVSRTHVVLDAVGRCKTQVECVA